MAGSAQKQGGAIEGINVTPLVDVILVLLVIFIVTAKFVIAPSVPLDLPQAANSEEIQTVLSVVIDRDGQLMIDGETATDAQLDKRARAALTDDPEVRAVIQADGEVRHRRVIGVLDVLKSAGLQKVAFGAVKPPAVDPPDEATP